MAEPPKQLVKIVRLVKPVKIKEEPLDEDQNELEIPCRLCSKSFCNEVALRNHLRMEHSGEEVDLASWVQDARMKQSSEAKAQSVQTKKMDQAMVAMKTQELVNSMKPQNIMSLANKEVSYIIIKAEDGKVGVERVGRKKKAGSDSEASVVKKQPVRRPEREIIPISGPFECLQPSTLVADGTCHQIFFSCCDYSIHFRDEHTRRRKAIKCQVCEKVLASAIGEEPTSPYPCQVCGSGFQSNKELTAHVNTAHIKLKPFECAICHKRFTQQGGVAQHMRMHTGDRPFSCSFCSKAFTQKSGLDQHLRTHTKVKPYRCVICRKTFVQSVHLKQHMRTHTHVAPFRCAVCEKRFKQSSHLNYHLKNHNDMNMTDDQKKKYHELISMIDDERRQLQKQTVDEEELKRAAKIIVEVEQSQQEESQAIRHLEEDSEDVEMLEEESEEVHLLEEESEEVQMINEESGDVELLEHDGTEIETVETVLIEENEDGDQVVLQDDREYILSDNGNETWSVKIVN